MFMTYELYAECTKNIHIYFLKKNCIHFRCRMSITILFSFKQFFFIKYISAYYKHTDERRFKENELFCGIFLTN